MAFTNQIAGFIGAAIGGSLSPKNYQGEGIALGLAIGFWGVDLAQWLWKHRENPEVRFVIKAVTSTTAGLLAHAITGSDLAMGLTTLAAIKLNDAIMPRAPLVIHVYQAEAGVIPEENINNPNNNQNNTGHPYTP